MTIPNFLIVGAAKAGTTALYNYLRQHPDIFMPPDIKETFFLSDIKANTFTGNAAVYANDAIDNIKDYCAIFRNAGAFKAIGEACVAYLFFHQQTIPNIEKFIGTNCKIIILLRNPVDRAFSNYLHHYRDGFETESFENALLLENKRLKDNCWWGFQYRKAGLYSTQVSAYIDKFDSNHVKIFLSSELSGNTGKLLREIFLFLDVDPDVSLDTRTRFNVSGIPKTGFMQKALGKTSMLRTTARLLVPQRFRRRIIRSSAFTALRNRNLEKPAMNSDTRAELERYYFDDIKALEAITGMDFSSWTTPLVRT